MGDPTPVALIVPHTNTVMEPDFARWSGGALAVTRWPIRLDGVTRAAEERMLAEALPEALERIAPGRPRVVVFGCTSAGALGGLRHDAEIVDLIADTTRTEVVTVVGAMVERLAALSPSTVAVLTPYAEELTRSVADCVAEAGYRVPVALGMGLEDNHEIGRVPHEVIVDFVVRALAGRSADCVFLSCTNWRAAEALAPIGRALGVPALSSNQVTYAALAERVA